MSRTILITRPEYDPTTRYLSFWSKPVIEQAKQSGCRVVDLVRGRANRKEFEGVIRKTNPNLVLLNGHGGPDAVYGQDEEVLVKSGADAYLGYDEDFVFYREIDKLSQPLEDKTAAYFFGPSNQVSLSLMKGHTPRSSYLQSQAAYKRTIRQLLLSSSVGKSHLLRFLIWDMQHQVCLQHDTTEPVFGKQR